MDNITEALSSLTPEEAEVALGLVWLRADSIGYDGGDLQERFEGAVSLMRGIVRETEEVFGPYEADFAKFGALTFALALIEASGPEHTNPASDSAE